MLTENKQLLRLVEQGFSVEDIAAMHNLDVDALRVALDSSRSFRSRTVEELQARYAPEMIDILADIARDSSLNESARVAAAKTIVEGKGMIPETGATKLSEMFQKMKRAVEANRPKDVEQPVLSVVSSVGS